MMESEASSVDESCVDDEARAMALAAYRTALEADTTSVLLYLYLSGQEGRPYTLEERKILFNYMVDDILEGKDPFEASFTENAGIVEEVILEEGGEENG